MYITFLYFSNNKYKTNFDISHDSLLVIDFPFLFHPPHWIHKNDTVLDGLHHFDSRDVSTYFNRY